jgi:hypothetical protein
MKVLLLKSYDGLWKGEYEVKEIEANFIEDGRQKTAVKIQKDGEEWLVPIDLVEFL